jgi:hypothetical protein
MTARLWIRGTAVLDPGAAPDISFVPPLQRRRMSPVQRIAFDLAKRASGDEPPPFVIHFSSRDGEWSHYHKLAETYNADGTVSPGRFSSSVFNASPGLYSILLGNQASYSALAADGETLESGLLDALLDDSGPRLWLYADETGGGFGAAAFFAESLPGDPVSLETGVFGDAPLRFEDVRAFLAGDVPSLSGRNLRLWRNPQSEVRAAP